MRRIDADAFFNDFPELRDYEYASQDYEVDAEPVKHGHWITDDSLFLVCSRCGRPYEFVGYDMNYCPNCGAKMDLDEVEE